MSERVYTQVFGVAGAIIERSGKILLVQESMAVARGLWNQPAGWIDVGEDPRDCVIREVAEETGLHFEPKGVLGVYSLARQDLGRHALKIIYYGECSGEPITSNEEIMATRWFTPEEIMAMGPAELRDADIKDEVRDYFARRFLPLDAIRHTAIHGAVQR